MFISSRLNSYFKIYYIIFIWHRLRKIIINKKKYNKGRSILSRTRTYLKQIIIIFLNLNLNEKENKLRGLEFQEFFLFLF